MSTCSVSIKLIILPTISALGILFNSLNAIIFSIILVKGKQKSNFFKYLFVKSISDTFQFIFRVLSPLYYTQDVSISDSYFSQIWYIWLGGYGEYITELYSDILEVLATLDCYSCLNAKYLKFLQAKKFFLCSIIVCFVYACLFYTFYIFELKIVDSSTVNNSDYTGFYVDYTQFHYSIEAKIIKLVDTTIRDLVISLALIILNILIFHFIKKSINFKRVLYQNNTDRAKALEKTKSKNKIMVIVIGVVHIVGHLPFIVYNLPFEKGGGFWACYYYVSAVPFYASYMTGFIIYLCFNKSFFKNAKELFLFFRKKKL